MSIIAIRAAMETALNGMSPALSTAWENAPFTPVAGTAYQRVDLVSAQPDNSEIGGANYVERGFLMVSLRYPVGAGPGATMARVLKLRQTFKCGASFTSGGIVVQIMGTPQLMGAQVVEDRYVQPVRIPFRAQVQG